VPPTAIGVRRARQCDVVKSLPLHRGRKLRGGSTVVSSRELDSAMVLPSRDERGFEPGRGSWG
jgi:hypothetical protein